MKRLIALLLAAILCLSLLAACGGGEKESTEDTQPTGEKAAPKDDGVLKILMIGHSLGNDSTFMVPEVFKTEGKTPMVMGVIYHSGCRLFQHVSFIKQNAAQYAYYEFDTEQDVAWRRADAGGGYHEFVPGSGTDTYIEDGTIAQTMQFGITRHDWDIVVLQAGVFEAANAPDSATKLNIAGDLNTVRQYVLDNDIDKATTPKFGWNMTWSCPSDAMMNDSYNKNLYLNFTDRIAMYEGIAKTVQEIVLPAYDFDYMMPSGTAIENAISGKYEPEDVYRDFIHVNDYGRMIVAYTWFCTLTGTDISECNPGTMSHKVLLDNLARNTGADLVLTDEQKAVLVEAVGNAIKTPYAITPSQLG